jgi:DNA-binding CsgD family transcriptional regulator
MSTLLILAMLILAFLLGPTAFVLLWVVWRRSGEDSLRLLALGVLGLCLILLGNAASFINENLLANHDARPSFLLMNAVFLATAMTGAFVNLFVYRATGLAAPAGHRAVFWVSSAGFFFLAVSLSIFVDGGGVDTARGYLAATCYSTLWQIWATAVLWRRRRLLPAFYARLAPPLTLGLLVLGILAVGNDVFNYGALLDGPGFPFSPFFFLLTALSVVVLCARELARPSPAPATPAAPAAPEEFDLSGRERDILPLILEGLSNEEIAARLFISPHTVKNHVTNIFRKAGVATRAGLFARLKP